MRSINVLVVLAVAAVARADVLDRETYDDLTGVMELMYPEQNYIEPTPEPSSVATQEPWKYEEPWRRILMYKMLTALRNRDATPSLLSVPKWIPSDTVLVPPDTFNYPPKGAILKRGEETPKPRASVKTGTRPQQKWKIKKGKGSSMICYFKLCTFRLS